MKPKGRNLYEQQGRAISRDRYQVARANINCARNRVQELVVLGRRTQSIQTAIRNSHILATLERDTRDLSAQRLSDFADDLLSKLLELEQEIVIKNERSIWEKDLRLIFVSEAIALSERAKLLDEAELSASYDQLTLTRSGAVTNYHLGREGLTPVFVTFSTTKAKTNCDASAQKRFLTPADFLATSPPTPAPKISSPLNDLPSLSGIRHSSMPPRPPISLIGKSRSVAKNNMPTYSFLVNVSIIILKRCRQISGGHP